MDQSLSRRLEKAGEDTPASPEIIEAYTLNFMPKLIFLQLILFFWEGGGPRPHWGVR